MKAEVIYLSSKNKIIHQRFIDKDKEIKNNQ